MEDFEKCVIDRISWAKDDAEKAIKEKNETSFQMSIGKLLALCGLAVHFGFSSSALPGCPDYGLYVNGLIDRFYDK